MFKSKRGRIIAPLVLCIAVAMSTAGCTLTLQPSTTSKQSVSTPQPSVKAEQPQDKRVSTPPTMYEQLQSQPASQACHEVLTAMKAGRTDLTGSDTITSVESFMLLNQCLGSTTTTSARDRQTLQATRSLVKAALAAAKRCKNSAPTPKCAELYGTYYRVKIAK